MYYSHAVHPMTYVETLLQINRNIKTKKSTMKAVLPNLVNIQSMYTDDNKFKLRFDDKRVVETNDPNSSEQKSLYLSLLDALCEPIFNEILNSNPEAFGYFFLNFKINNNLYVSKSDPNNVAFLIATNDDVIVYKKQNHPTDPYKSEIVVSSYELFYGQYKQYEPKFDNSKWQEQ